MTAVDSTVSFMHFSADPDAGEARHRPAVEAVIEDLLHAGRIEDRDHHVDEVEFGLMRGGRGFAVWSSPISASTPPCCEVPARLAWRNTSPVRSTPGPLPYQMPNTPSYLPSPRSSACCVPHSAVAARSSLRPGWKTMSFGVEDFRGALELLVEPAERRAAIAGDVAGGVQPGAAVALLLHQAQAHERLIAGDEDPALASDRICRRG